MTQLAKVIVNSSINHSNGRTHSWVRLVCNNFFTKGLSCVDDETSVEFRTRIDFGTNDTDTL